MEKEQIRPTWRRRLLLLAKACWVIAVLVVAAWFLIHNRGEIRRYAESLGAVQLLISLLAVVIGRWSLAEISRGAVAMHGIKLTSAESFSINAVSQLGKYVPGNIWHLVGRVAVYRRFGLSNRQGSGVLVVENVALLLSGICVGFGALADLAFRLDRFASPLEVQALGLAAVAGTVLWLGIVPSVQWLVGGRYTFLRRLPRGPILWGCLGLWTAFGVGFTALLPRGDISLAAFLAATGTFSLAWVVGNLAPFAPAGIGVREVVIVALLAPRVGTATALGIAAGSRLVWTTAELAIAPLASYHLARATKRYQRKVS